MSSLPARRDDSLGAVTLVDPFSGEVVDVSDPVVAAEFVDALRQSKNIIDKLIHQVTDVLTPEFERQGTKTLNVGRYELELKETASYEWDEEELQKLLDAGLPPERYAELVKETVSRRVSQNIAKQLETSPAYQPIIEQARTRKVKGRTLEVRVAKGAVQ